MLDFIPTEYNTFYRLKGEKTIIFIFPIHL